MFITANMVCIMFECPIGPQFKKKKKKKKVVILTFNTYKVWQTAVIHSTTALGNNLLLQFVSHIIKVVIMKYVYYNILLR